MRQQEQKELLLLQVASLKGRIEAIVHPAPSVQPGLKNTVSYYDLPFEGKIAEGSFATVYQGFLEDHLVAIKTLRGTLKPTEAQRFIREVAIMSDLRYPQITVFYGACLEQSYACLVMEYMAQGSLSKVLAEQDLSLEQKKSLALDVANALHHLHQKNILHRDLKTSNVLINAAGVAKLSDFGLSKPDSTQLEGYGRLGERETIPADVPEPLAALIKACWKVDPLERPSARALIQGLEAYQIRPPSLTAHQLYDNARRDEAEGRFVPAFEGYQKAANKGHAKANSCAGVLCLQGKGSAVDKQSALGYFLTASEAGDARAMYNVARMYEKGDGVVQDIDKALSWYQQSQATGNPEAAKKCEALRRASYGS